MCCRNMQDCIDTGNICNKWATNTGKINKLSSKGDNFIIIGHISSQTCVIANAFKLNLPFLMSNFV